MDPPGNADDNSNGSAAMRPTTLSILLSSSLLSPMDSSFRTPSISELTPGLRSTLEEFLQNWRPSPQTPGNFLSPRDTPEDGERFANNLIQKLLELKDSSCLNPASVRSVAPAVSGTDDINMADIGTPTLYDFANACRQVSAAAAQQQQQQQNASTTQILLCSPTVMTSHSLAEALSKASNGGNCSEATGSITLDTSSLGCDLKSFQTAIRNSLSIALPSAGKDLTTLQICNGPTPATTTQYELTGTSNASATTLTNSSNSILSPPSVLKLEQVAAELNSTLSVADASQSLTDSLLWPLLIQTSIANEHAAAVAAQLEARNSTGRMSSSPRDDQDATRPSSTGNGPADPGTELSDRSQLPAVTTTAIGFRSSSPVSSNSSMSQPHGTDPSGRELRLDPTEQVRMRLERKRARNRDAARKCRERKIGLIKRLEKEVSHLSEENKCLRTRLFNSRREVERLKLFVINHLHNECPALANKLA